MEGKCFFSASLDGTVAMIDTSSTTVLHHFKSVDAEVLCLAKVSSSTFSILSHTCRMSQWSETISAIWADLAICSQFARTNKQKHMYVCMYCHLSFSQRLILVTQRSSCIFDWMDKWNSSSDAFTSARWGLRSFLAPNMGWCIKWTCEPVRLIAFSTASRSSWLCVSISHATFLLHGFMH